MVVAVCQGNAPGAYAIAQKVAAAATAGGGPPTTEAVSAGQLASALRSVYGGAGSMVADLELRLAGQDPGACRRALPAGTEEGCSHTGNAARLMPGPA